MTPPHFLFSGSSSSELPSTVPSATPAAIASRIGPVVYGSIRNSHLVRSNAPSVLYLDSAPPVRARISVCFAARAFAIIGITVSGDVKFWLAVNGIEVSMGWVPCQSPKGPNGTPGGPADSRANTPQAGSSGRMTGRRRMRRSRGQRDNQAMRWGGSWSRQLGAGGTATDDLSHNLEPDRPVLQCLENLGHREPVGLAGAGDPEPGPVESRVGRWRDGVERRSPSGDGRARRAARRRPRIRRAHVHRVPQVRHRLDRDRAERVGAGVEEPSHQF